MLGVSYLKLKSLLFIIVSVLFCISPFYAPVSVNADENPLIFVGNDDDAPYSFLSDGSPSGYSVDLVRILSATIGKDIDIKLMPHDQCLEQMKSAKADGLIKCIIDPESQKYLDYSIPIGICEYAIFIKVSSTHINSLKSLEGTVVGIYKGCLIKDYLEKQKTITLLEAESLSELISKLKNHEIMAFIAEKNTVLYYIQKHMVKDLEIVGPPVGQTFPYSIAVKKEDKKLLEDINRGIRTLEENGTLEKLKRKWFGLKLVVAFPWKMVIVLTSGITLTMLILVGILWVVSLDATVKAKTKQIQIMSKKMVEKDKLAVLGKLAGQIAHELRTPLSIINNSVYLLRKEGSKNRELFEKRLSVLEDKIKLTSNILESILSYSRVKAEVASEVSVEKCVEEVLKDIAIPKEIEKEVSYEDDKVLKVFMDFHQLYSVIRNIVLNAIQAMEDKGKLKIDVTSVDHDTKIHIRICDTGKGIAEGAKNKIFNLFYSTKIMGTGLGLPISKSIIEANQGKLILKETTKKGACFVIELPSTKVLKK